MANLILFITHTSGRVHDSCIPWSPVVGERWQPCLRDSPVGTPFLRLQCARSAPCKAPSTHTAPPSPLSTQTPSTWSPCKSHQLKTKNNSSKEGVTVRDIKFLKYPLWLLTKAKTTTYSKGLIIIIISSLIKQRSKELGWFLTINCWIKTDLLITVGSEPLSRSSIIT